MTSNEDKTKEEIPIQDQPSTSSSTERDLSETKCEYLKNEKINENDLEINFRAERLKNSIQTFNLSISTETFSKSVTLAKCDLCSHMSYLCENEQQEEESINFSSLKLHIINAHLVGSEKKEKDENENVIKSLLSSLVDKIEEELGNFSSSFNSFKHKCTFCPSGSSIFITKFELSKHLLESHSECLNMVDCMHCSEKFSLKNMKEFFTHLKRDHSDDCLKSIKENAIKEITNNQDNNFNWQKYFSVHSLKEESKSDVVVTNEPVIESVSGSEASNEENQTKETQSNENDDEDLSSKSTKSCNNEEASPQEEQHLPQPSQLDEDNDSMSKQEENSKSDESEKSDLTNSQKNKPKIKKPKSDLNEERYFFKKVLEIVIILKYF